MLEVRVAVGLDVPRVRYQAACDEWDPKYPKKGPKTVKERRWDVFRVSGQEPTRPMDFHARSS